MALRHWKKLSESVVYSNDYWKYKLDRFEIESGTSGEYHYVHTLGSTLIIPVTDTNKILLINQYRYLVDKESIEFPCGSVEEGFSFDENAQKELREETGYSARDLNFVGKFAPYNGVSNELCYVYIGRNLFFDSLPKDHTEEFELIESSVDEVNKMIENNTIWDGMTLAGWQLSKKFLQ